MFDIKNADPMIKNIIRKMLHGQYYRLLDPETNEVYDYQNGQLSDAKYRCFETWGRSTPCGHCISKRALREKHPIIKLEMARDKIFLACALPITIDEKLMSLEVAWNVTESIASDCDSQAQNLLITELVSRFNMAVLQDAYTGLYNKRSAEENLEKEVQAWTQEKPLTVIMMDIDQFKKINDTYGHTLGDEVIMAIAQILKKQAELLGGFACREGGDEFLLILPCQTVEKGGQVLKQIKKSLEACTFDEERPFQVSISGGFAEYNPNMKHWKKLLEEADRRMYMEKAKKFKNQ